MATWTDSPATSTTHIRAVHINEIRKTVLRNRYKARLGWFNWSDGPTITSRTHIRVVHFTELRTAIQQYMALPNWSVGAAPSTSRQISARDTNDLRTWTDQFSQALGYPLGPDPAIQGITSFAFDPTTLNPGVPGAVETTIDSAWAQDISNLTPTTVPLWIRTNVRSGSASTNYDQITTYYAAYQTAFQAYKNANMPVYALLGSGEFLRTGYPNRSNNLPPDGSNAYFTNDYINSFSVRTLNFASAMQGFGLGGLVVWNEPNDVSGAYLDPRAFASLLNQCAQELSALSVPVPIMMGGLLWPIGLPKPSPPNPPPPNPPIYFYSAADATQFVISYLTPVRDWLRANNLPMPWDAVNVHVYHCSFTQQHMTDLRSAIDGLFVPGELRPVYVGEWGPTHNDYTAAGCLSNAYSYIRSAFDAMWYFQHPNRDQSQCCDPGTCPNDFGTMRWGYGPPDPGSAYQTFVTNPHCNEWSSLNILLQQR